MFSVLAIPESAGTSDPARLTYSRLAVSYSFSSSSYPEASLPLSLVFEASITQASNAKPAKLAGFVSILERA